MASLLKRIITWSFYLLFFFTPLVFTSDTSELFELNKMWLVWELTIIIIASWLGKMILQKSIRIQRTPLDIPILLFLASQLISTIFSLDFHTSFWGYYSRFNGGFLSLLSYILLYYALVSNTDKKTLIRYIVTGLASAVVVALWGLPSHFGYDPTCFLFRGSLDVSCWTFAFQPKVRIFSTLGQPDWLAAYLCIFIPVALALSVYFQKTKQTLFTVIFLLTTILFFIDLLFTRARSGIAGLVASLIIFLACYIWLQRKEITNKIRTILTSEWIIIAIFAIFFIFAFFFGTGVDQFDNKLTLSSFQQHFAVKQAQPQKTEPTHNASASVASGEIGGTDSGKIRLFVWQGALEAWKHYPIFGSGTETFAYVYYLYRPAGHNLTSEWDYLYNKAHNEYLNYLATTGAVGLLTYLSIIGLFFWLLGKRILKTVDATLTLHSMLMLGFLAGFVSILVTNFFGFSVVVVNLYLFLIPAFIFILDGALQESKMVILPRTMTQSKNVQSETSGFQWLGISIVTVLALFFLITLFRFWTADKAYGLGLNLDHAGEYQTAYQPLHDAVVTRPSEPTFQDELSINDAILASALVKQDPQTTNKLAQEALQTSTNLVTNHPNIVTYWKTRVRVLYALSQINPNLGADALSAIEKAHALAPTDAKVSYNMGLILGQSGNLDQAIQVLQETIKLKPNYSDPYYALGLFYHSAAVDKNNKIIRPDMQQKAIDIMHYYIDHFQDNKRAQDALKSWGVE